MCPEMQAERGTEAPYSGTRASRPTSTDPTADARLEMLRAITRQMATAEDLDTVLHSITTALVERAGAKIARIFLLLRDNECAICRARIESGQQVASDEPAVHLVASTGLEAEPRATLHRMPLDSPLPAAQLLRTRTPVLIEDWREVPDLVMPPPFPQLWQDHGIIGLAGYPLSFRGELVGVIGYFSPHRIDAREFELLGIFADQAAMAIKNAYLFRELARHKQRLQDENAYLQDEIRIDHGFEHIVGASPSLRNVLRKVRQVSSVETTVLLTGETGTGKELIARALHDESPRRDRAMIKINCGAIPQGIIESELFGHEKGAFTGALQRRIGRFELADKGTLFMDEVGELSLDTQVKLLRVLQEQEFERVGGTKPIQVDVRLIAATNRDLEREVKEKRYRPDLFYRLNVFPIRIPPLRERPGDIPLLVRHFLAHFQRKLAKPLEDMTPASLEQLQRYQWPGNIRELQNVLERACVLARGPEVDLASPLRATAAPSVAASGGAPILTLAERERRHIRRALAAAKGRVHGPQGAAALLGVNPNTLRSRMQKLGVTKQTS